MSIADEEVGLLPEERTEIEQLIGRYDERRAAAIEALKLVQNRHRWVSDQRLGELAALLEMTPGELDSVATFYNLVFRRPVGRHIIMVCDSISCWLMGQEALRRGLEDRLGIRFGETTADGRFTILPIVCLGYCDHAPALTIDGEFHGDLEATGLDSVLAAYR